MPRQNLAVLLFFQDQPRSVRMRATWLQRLSMAAAFCCCATGFAPAQKSPEPAPLRVAAAISLPEALETIAADFEKETGTKVALSLGSSGQLLAQIRMGAPLDVFVSAAHEQVDALEREGLLQRLPRRIIACNELALIAPKNS